MREGAEMRPWGLVFVASVVLTLTNVVMTVLNVQARHRNYDQGWADGYVAAVDSLRATTARNDTLTYYAAPPDTLYLGLSTYARTRP
jgi:hypothetical protein